GIPASARPKAEEPGDGGDAATTRAVLQGIPARLAAATSAHMDDLVRELHFVDDGDGVVDHDIAVELPGLLERFAPLRRATADAARASSDGSGRFDVDIALHPTAAQDLRRVEELLDRANEISRRDGFLTPPPTAEVIAFRRWCSQELLRQIAGRPSTACPFEPQVSPWESADSAAEGRLREARYRSLVESADLDVWRADATGALVSDMPAWREHTGQDDRDLLGDGWLAAVHADDRERVAATWRRAVETGAPFACEYPIVAPDGSTRIVVARGTPVREGGAVREWIGTTFDVTDQRRAASELAEQARLLGAMHDIGIALSTTLDVDQLLPQLVEATTRSTGAAFGAFFFNRVDDNGEDYQLVTLHGASIDQFDFGMPRNTGVFAPTFGGERAVRFDDVTRAPEFGKNAPHYGMPEGHLPVRSYLAVPVLSSTGTVHGGLFFGHPKPGMFTEAHERMVVAIASQASVAIDNALLLEAERSARAAAEEAQRRQDALAAATAGLAASLDLDETARVLARAVVPSVGDWSVVRISDGSSRAAHAGPVPARAEEAPGAAMVPLRSADREVGSLAVGRSDGSPLDAAALAVLEEIGRRGGVAVDNALLYRQHRSAALVLQRTLLPHDRPALPGFAYAIRYLPAAAGSGSEVGGDWYDVVRLGEASAVVAVGDVQGKGIQAAAYMGQLRAGKRAYTLAGLGPAAVLQLLDRMWELQADVLATCIHAEIELATASLRIADAGHAAPIRFGAGAPARAADVKVGPPIGVGGGVYLESTLTLARGEGLVLFTDGLVEHRNRPIDEGIAMLRSVLDEAASGTWTPESVADAVLGELLAIGHDDDVALLVLARNP
ncbi:MAG TPA: SpoIIE family protein phosphatase, partial [Acidimicrobiales bacterium]